MFYGAVAQCPVTTILTNMRISFNVNENILFLDMSLHARLFVNASYSHADKKTRKINKFVTVGSVRPLDAYL